MLKRRTVLLAATAIVGTGGALVVGWSIAPSRQRLTAVRSLALDGPEVALNGWVKIGADESITVMMCKSEMGQGIHTGLAMVLAEELDADWPRVRIEHSPIDGIYNNQAAVVDGLPFHPDDNGVAKKVAGWLVGKAMREFGTMMTGGSSSMKDLWLPMREAGASARSMLVAAAAGRWQTPVSECWAEKGSVRSRSGLRATFGELAEIASRQPLPQQVRLKDPARFSLIGRPLPRIEALSKLNGSARFGIDAAPEGLLYASVVMCPTLGGVVRNCDPAAALRLSGVVKVVQVPAFNGGTGGVAVIARTPFEAMRALKHVAVEWNHGNAASMSSEAIYAQLDQANDEAAGHVYYSHGNADAAIKAASTVVTAQYRAPYLAHAAMEPINCTAQFKDGAATVWASTQMPSVARDNVAGVLGIQPEKVDIRVQLLGGAFGRRLEVDFISQAAAIAREADGAPVQTLWSREEDIAHDYYRPACVARFRAGLDAHGALVGWENQSAGQAVVPNFVARGFGISPPGPDKTTSEGAFDQAYQWPNATISHRTVDLPIPVGFWRSVGNSHQAFFKESFLDEVAVAANKDPVDFRAALLFSHPRHLAVLKRAAASSGWGQPLAPAADGAQKARGIALHSCFGSIVAQVAEVSLGPDKGIRVHRVVCVVDCGTPVNPNLIRQQMEGAIVFGLSAALYEEIVIAKGQVQQSNYHDFPVIRMDACPDIETEIMPSQAPPEGVGEPGTPPIAPAIANALFVLTGQRLRSLPLKLA